MRVLGFCHQCRRSKQVTVSGNDLARLAVSRSQIPTGVCDECRDRDQARTLNRRTR